MRPRFISLFLAMAFLFQTGELSARCFGRLRCKPAQTCGNMLYQVLKCENGVWIPASSVEFTRYEYACLYAKLFVQCQNFGGQGTACCRISCRWEKTPVKEPLCISPGPTIATKADEEVSLWICKDGQWHRVSTGKNRDELKRIREAFFPNCAAEWKQPEKQVYAPECCWGVFSKLELEAIKTIVDGGTCNCAGAIGK